MDQLSLRAGPNECYYYKPCWSDPLGLKIGPLVFGVREKLKMGLLEFVGTSPKLRPP